jgi:hypothetical protein
VEGVELGFWDKVLTALAAQFLRAVVVARVDKQAIMLAKGVFMVAAALLKMVLVQEPFVLFGPAQLVNFHQQIQGTCDGIIYSN